MRYLIDTNIIIDHLRIRESKSTEFLQKIEDGQIQAFISVITEFELFASRKITPKQQKEIKKLLTILPSIPINSEIAHKSAQFYRKYQLSLGDCLIAGTAYYLKAVLITRDKTFTKIKEIKIKVL